MLRRTKEVITIPLIATGSSAVGSITIVRTFGAAPRSNDHDTRYEISE